MRNAMDGLVFRITLVLTVQSFVIWTSQAVPTTLSVDVATEYFTLGMNTAEEATDEMTTLPVDETVAMTTKEETTKIIPAERLWKSVRAKFTLADKSNSDIGDELRNEIESSINSILRERFTDYNTSVVKGFSSGSLIAFVELDFNTHMSNVERSEVVKVLYEIVERNNTLGGLNVQQLYVTNTKGVYQRIENACDIKPCWEGMTCFSDGNECRSVCTQNTKYCLNGAACIEKAAGTTFIGCRCEDGFYGSQCEKEEGQTDYNGNDDLFVGIIAASVIAGIIVCAVVTATCINIMNKRRTRHSRSEELFGIENVVALELTDEKPQIDGIATQTDESFLLARSHKDGVPPKTGHAHKIMQTNDSFLLIKAQLLKAQGASRSKGAGSPVGVVSGNARRVSCPSSSKSGDVDAAAGRSSVNGGANKVARKASSKKERAPQPPLNPAAQPTDASVESNIDEPKSLEKSNGVDDHTTISDRMETSNESSGQDIDVDVKQPYPKNEKVCDVDKNPSSTHSLPSGRKILKV